MRKTAAPANILRVLPSTTSSDFTLAFLKEERLLVLCLLLDSKQQMEEYGRCCGSATVDAIGMHPSLQRILGASHPQHFPATFEPVNKFSKREAFRCHAKKFLDIRKT